MLYTRKQMMEEVCRKVDEERRERMFYETLEEFRVQLEKLTARVEELENSVIVIEHSCHGRK